MKSWMLGVAVIVIHFTHMALGLPFEGIEQILIAAAQERMT
jgi:hypothetical protein